MSPITQPARDINEATLKELIYQFYESCHDDVMIGYHFRALKMDSIRWPQFIDSSTKFWLKVLDENTVKLSPQILKLHLPMNLKEGQINRWDEIFEQTVLNSNFNESEKKRITQLRGQLVAEFLENY